MEKFNLEKALAGKPVIARIGKKVEEIHFFKTNVEKPLVVVIEGKMIRYNKEGLNNPGKEDPLDLFMLPEKKVIWVNVYNKGKTLMLGKFRDATEQEAIKNITDKENYIKTIEITNN